ncbi:unnamed protein product [Dibothriocephalus latus]|uniref:Integrase catalytic domain-containing protein n=1 Tax=Dibothriocephalus latus TaxID=60516 RepID=A0A3P7P8L7_DIBLA|nr:unnamed protein product [Dibothriocephalus latus]
MRRFGSSSLHNLSHPGSRPTDKLVSERLVWHGIYKDLIACIRTFLSCQQTTVQRHNKAPSGIFLSPGARFGHVDIGSSLPLSKDCFDLLTCVSRYIRRLEASLLPNVEAFTVVKAFRSHWAAIFGAPSTITTDHRAQFESNLFQSPLSFLSCIPIRTTAYYPAVNRVVK